MKKILGLLMLCVSSVTIAAPHCVVDDSAPNSASYVTHVGKTYSIVAYCYNKLETATSTNLKFSTKIKELTNFTSTCPTVLTEGVICKVSAEYVPLVLGQKDIIIDMRYDSVQHDMIGVHVETLTVE